MYTKIIFSHFNQKKVDLHPCLFDQSKIHLNKRNFNDQRCKIKVDKESIIVHVVEFIRRIILFKISDLEMSAKKKEKIERTKESRL